jgi:hypothetical protein
MQEEPPSHRQEPVPCVWQAFYLRVTTLAGVTAYGITQVDNVAQSLQERSGEKVVAGSATERAVTVTFQVVDFTEGAAQ